MAAKMDIIHPNEWPQGLTLYKNVIEPANERKLFDYIDGLVWENALSRKVQHYGYQYQYDIREPQVRILKKTAEPPRILKCLADSLFNMNLLQEYPNQIIVNRYSPGEGIGKHRDHYPIFGTDIATISLGSDIDMHFEPYKDLTKGEMLTVRLTKGSILVFGGDARMNWSHEIKKRKTDIVDGKKVARGDRISITFRRVNNKYAE